MSNTCSNGSNKNRFCYSYKPQGFIQSYCKPVVAATNSYISSIACLSSVTNGQMQASDQSLLLSRQKSMIVAQSSTFTGLAVQNTIQNAATISNNINGQLEEIAKQRAAAYRPYIYPVVPISVIQLQMATANVGVPVTPITCLTGKGNQSITQ